MKGTEQKKMLDYTTPLTIAKVAAWKAGREILRIYHETDRGIKTKPGGSPVTKADEVADSIIRETLEKKCAGYGYGMLTEESGDDRSRLTKEHVWIIDPLDGTKEFIAKNGEFTVNIGLVRYGTPVLGVVYVPITNEFYYAAEGKGAQYQKGKELSEMQVSLEGRVEKMRVLISRSHAETEREVIKQFGEVIVKGSSIKGCLIAQGRAEVFVKLGSVSEWDICAVDAIITEAGGRVTDLQGERLKYNQEKTATSPFVMSNNANHAEILRKMREYKK